MVIKKNVVYTVLTGNENYTLKSVQNKNPNWDYLCFTDLPRKAKGWKYVIIPNKKNSQKLSRDVKIQYFKYVNDYDISVYIDTKFTPIKNIDTFTKNAIMNHDLCVMSHPKRTTITEEVNHCIKVGKDKKETLLNQMNHYSSKGFLDNVGLYAPGIMIRKHGNVKLEKFMKLWYEQIEQWSHRDIISFSYTLWKHPIAMNVIDFKKTYNHFKA